MMREIERDDLDVTPDHILVLKNAGPEGRPRHAGVGHAADPQAPAGAGRARHDPHLRRPHERHELRRLHPACRAGKLRRRAARLRADRRRDRDRRRQADRSICTSATRNSPAARPPGSSRRRNTPRGYGAMFSEHIGQADQGCDFDFLQGKAAMPRAGDSLIQIVAIVSIRHVMRISGIEVPCHECRSACQFDNRTGVSATPASCGQLRTAAISSARSAAGDAQAFRK